MQGRRINHLARKVLTECKCDCLANPKHMSSQTHCESYCKAECDLIAASYGVNVHVWRSDGELVRTLGDRNRRVTMMEPSDQVKSIDISPDRTKVAAGRRDGWVCVWNVRSGDVHRMLKGNTDDHMKSDVTSVAFSSDGARIASGSQDGKVRIYNANTGELLHTLIHDNDPGFDPVISVAFSGNRIMSGSKNTTKIWNADTNALVREIDDYLDAESVRLSPDGEKLVVGSRWKEVHVLSTSTGNSIHTFLHPWPVTSVAFSPDGNRVVAGCIKTVHVWSVETGDQIQTIDDEGVEVVEEDLISSVEFSPDGTRIVVKYDSAAVLIWDVENGRLIRTLTRGN